MALPASPFGPAMIGPIPAATGEGAPLAQAVTPHDPTHLGSGHGVHHLGVLVQVEGGERFNPQGHGQLLGLVVGTCRQASSVQQGTERMHECKSTFGLGRNNVLHGRTRHCGLRSARNARDGDG